MYEAELVGILLGILGTVLAVLHVLRVMIPAIIEALGNLWRELEIAWESFKAARTVSTDRCPCSNSCLVRMVKRLIEESNE